MKISQEFKNTVENMHMFSGHVKTLPQDFFHLSFRQQTNFVLCLYFCTIKPVRAYFIGYGARSHLIRSLQAYIDALLMQKCLFVILLTHHVHTHHKKQSLLVCKYDMLIMQTRQLSLWCFQIHSCFPQCFSKQQF